jgi:hypothetical protein
VDINPELSKAAGEAAKEALKEFPIPVMCLVGNGLNGNPFDSKKRGGGGGGGNGGPRGAANIPEVGTMLIGQKPKGTFHEATVVETDDGPRIQLADGRQFTSKSKAAGAITGHSTNGNVFWSEKASEAQAAAPAQEAKPAEPKKEATATKS